MRHGEATKLTDKEMKGINIYMKVCTGDVQRVFKHSSGYRATVGLKAMKQQTDSPGKLVTSPKTTRR